MRSMSLLRAVSVMALLLIFGFAPTTTSAQDASWCEEANAHGDGPGG